jgi:C4-dicarboxylate transporter, DctQ subunit
MRGFDRIARIKRPGRNARLGPVVSREVLPDMRRIAVAYLHFLDFLKALAGAVIFAVFALIVADVLMRLIGVQSWLYSSVLVEYGLLWFTMLSAPWLARNKKHVFIDAVTQMLPAPIQRAVAKLVYFVCVCVSFAVCYYASVLLVEAFAQHQIDTRAVDMPLWTLLAPIPLCFFLVGIEFLRFLLGFDSMYSSRTELRESA